MKYPCFIFLHLICFEKLILSSMVQRKPVEEAEKLNGGNWISDLLRKFHPPWHSHLNNTNLNSKNYLKATVMHDFGNSILVSVSGFLFKKPGPNHTTTPTNNSTLPKEHSHDHCTDNYLETYPPILQCFSFEDDATSEDNVTVSACTEATTADDGHALQAAALETFFWPNLAIYWSKLNWCAHFPEPVMFAFVNVSDLALNIHIGAYNSSLVVAVAGECGEDPNNWIYLFIICAVTFPLLIISIFLAKLFKIALNCFCGIGTNTDGTRGEKCGERDATNYLTVTQLVTLLRATSASVARLAMLEAHFISPTTMSATPVTEPYPEFSANNTIVDSLEWEHELRGAFVKTLKVEELLRGIKPGGNDEATEKDDEANSAISMCQGGQRIHDESGTKTTGDELRALTLVQIASTRQLMDSICGSLVTSLIPPSIGGGGSGAGSEGAVEKELSKRESELLKCGETSCCVGMLAQLGDDMNTSGSWDAISAISTTTEGGARDHGDARQTVAWDVMMETMASLRHQEIELEDVKMAIESLQLRFQHALEDKKVVEEELRHVSAHARELLREKADAAEESTYLIEDYAQKLNDADELTVSLEMEKRELLMQLDQAKHEQADISRNAMEAKSVLSVLELKVQYLERGTETERVQWVEKLTQAEERAARCRAEARMCRAQIDEGRLVTMALEVERDRAVSAYQGEVTTHAKTAAKMMELEKRHKFTLQQLEEAKQQMQDSLLLQKDARKDDQDLRSLQMSSDNAQMMLRGLTDRIYIFALSSSLESRGASYDQTRGRDARTPMAMPVPLPVVLDDKSPLLEEVRRVMDASSALMERFKVEAEAHAEFKRRLVVKVDGEGDDDERHQPSSPPPVRDEEVQRAVCLSIFLCMCVCVYMCLYHSK